MSDVNDITKMIVDACLCVHRKFGPGLLESVYEKLLMVELKKRGLAVECQKSLPLVYEGVRFEDAYRIDMLVNGEVIVELKSTNVMHPVYAKQLKTYLALSGLHVGILANFGMATMKEGIKRVVYEYAGQKPSGEDSAPSASPREEKEITRGAAENAEEVSNESVPANLTSKRMSSGGNSAPSASPREEKAVARGAAENAEEVSNESVPANLTSKRMSSGGNSAPSASPREEIKG